MEDPNQHVDHQQRIRRPGGNSSLVLAPCHHLNGGPLWVRAQVQIDIIEAFAGGGPVRDQAPHRVVDAQPEPLLQFFVSLTGRRLLDQKHRRRTQRATGRKPDALPGRPPGPSSKIAAVTNVTLYCRSLCQYSRGAGLLPAGTNLA